MPKIHLRHRGNGVGASVDPDADKPRNHTPFRFRVGYGVTVTTGVDTFFMSRDQVDALQTDVLNEILHDKALDYDVIVQNAETRAANGVNDLTNLVKSVGHLTHPDVLMLVDMRANAEKYIPSASPFAAQFSALASKVMDLTFYNCAFGAFSTQRVKDFKALTGAVVRGMNQFEYYIPNHAPASPYVNFSVLPLGEQYESVRFPTYYNSMKQAKERIPKSSFKAVYLFYINELFEAYRRYLRLLRIEDAEPGPSSAVAGAPKPEEDQDPEPEPREPIDPENLLGDLVIEESPSVEKREESPVEKLKEDFSGFVLTRLHSGKYKTIETATNSMRKSLTESDKYERLRKAYPTLVDDLIKQHGSEFRAKKEGETLLT